MIGNETLKSGTDAHMQWTISIVYGYKCIEISFIEINTVHSVVL